MPHYLIIGSGVAGITAAQTIREHDPKGCITLVTHESTPFYNRIRLGELISGDLSRQDLAGLEPGWYDKQRIDVKLGTSIHLLHGKKKEAITRHGETLSWDRLLLATGAFPLVPSHRPSSEKKERKGFCLLGVRLPPPRHKTTGKLPPMRRSRNKISCGMMPRPSSPAWRPDI